MIKTFDEAVDALKNGDPYLKAGFGDMSDSALTAIAFGRINCVAMARAEMASRGLNLLGNWVGYEEARRVWGCVAEPRAGEIVKQFSICLHDEDHDVHRFVLPGLSISAALLAARRCEEDMQTRFGDNVVIIIQLPGADAQTFGSVSAASEWLVPRCDTEARSV